MADDGTVLTVFVASPGDVAHERAFVRTFLESTLPKQLAHPGRQVHFQVVSWDHPEDRTPMLAHLTPQEAVIESKPRPAGCDIVVVILWSRIGTKLDPAKFQKPNGGGDYESGTEWEFEDAIGSPSKPDVLVYRRADPPPIDVMKGSFRDDVEFGRSEPGGA